MPVDLTRRKYGRLLVLEPANPGHTFYRCQCLCGNKITVSRGYLLSHRPHSCGCCRDALVTSALTLKLRQHWRHLVNLARVARSRDPTSLSRLDPSWLDYQSFSDWALSSQGYQDGMVLELGEPGQSYGPNTCRFVWPPRSRRGRRDRILRTRSRSRTGLTRVNGVNLNLHKLAAAAGMSFPTLYQRLRNGWSLLEAITLPVGRQNKKGE